MMRELQNATATARSDVCDIDHTHNHSDWFLYALAVPTFLGGVAVCFGGFQLSRRMRFLFGFIIAYVTTVLSVEATAAPGAVVVVVALVAALLFAPITSKYYRVGVAAIGDNHKNNPDFQ